MPFLFILSKYNDVHLALWEIRESRDDMINIFQFTLSEKESYSKIIHERTAVQWLSSRLCLKNLLRECGYLHGEIVQNNKRKPFVADSRIHVSLSHSHDLSCAGISTREIGVDVEKIRKRENGIEKRFLNPEELSHFYTQMSDAALTVLWSLKESLYKSDGKGDLSFKNSIKFSTYPDLNSEEGICEAEIVRENKKQCYHAVFSRIQSYVFSYAVRIS